MKKIWPDIDNWPSEFHIKEVGYHGGGFIGGDCRKLLKNVDALEQVCPLNILPFVKVLRLFNKVIEGCFGKELCPAFKDKIKSFYDAYCDLGIIVTPKIHILVKHVPEFCKMKNASLSLFSEQASESVHANFKKFWERRKVKSLDNQNYTKALFDSVVEFNSFHI